MVPLFCAFLGLLTIFFNTTDTLYGGYKAQLETVGLSSLMKTRSGSEKQFLPLLVDLFVAFSRFS